MERSVVGIIKAISRIIMVTMKLDCSTTRWERMELLPTCKHGYEDGRKQKLMNMMSPFKKL
jgi:hypothetical protein